MKDWIKAHYDGCTYMPWLAAIAVALAGLNAFETLAVLAASSLTLYAVRTL